MAENSYLQLMVQSEYYDGAIDYFNSKFNLWQMDPSGRLKERMRWEGYRSDHMIYLCNEDLETANEDNWESIVKSTPLEGQPVKYLKENVITN
jgi:carboxypeptidase C (cathepsin A)